MLTEWYRKFGKRLFDLAVVIMALSFLAPVIAVVVALVRLQLGAPVLFRQRRPGLHGRPFAILKLRTMTDARDTDGNLLPDAERLTSLGRFLRRTSIDELPTLINVLRGEMSLVGPRPCLAYEATHYKQWHSGRFRTLPGLTGLWQVNGKNRTTFTEMMRLDVAYVHKKSMWLDLRILLSTVPVIVKELVSRRNLTKVFRLATKKDKNSPLPFSGRKDVEDTQNKLNCYNETVSSYTYRRGGERTPWLSDNTKITT